MPLSDPGAQLISFGVIVTMTKIVTIPTAATSSLVSQIPDPAVETFTIRLPRSVSRWLPFVAEQDSMTPEQFLATNAARMIGCALEGFGDMQDELADIALVANGGGVDVVLPLDAELVRKTKKLGKATGANLNDIVDRGLRAVLKKDRAEQAAKAA